MVRIVRDTMQRTEPFTDPQELKVFVSKLYVYLVDEMHKALNKVTHAQTNKHTYIVHINVHFYPLLLNRFIQMTSMMTLWMRSS